MDLSAYDLFQYKLPEGSADEYAGQAIQILQEMKIEFPEFYDEFKIPSEVLTLSGVRAFDTYNGLGESATKEQIAGIKALLRKHRILLLEEEFLPANDTSDDHQYSLVHLDALDDLPNSYAYIPGWKPFYAEAMKQDFDFMTWWQLYWQKGIAVEARDNKHIQKALQHDWWVSHNISFGMLLGYPGEAIVSCITENENDKITDARIEHVDKFDGPKPVYVYHAFLANHPNIVAHEKLWSDILMKVYKTLP
jgi:hypothetical protein